MSPETFKQLKSFMDSEHHLTRYITKLAKTASDLGLLLKNIEINQPIIWSQHLDTRIACDASSTGIGASLE